MLRRPQPRADFIRILLQKKRLPATDSGSWGRRARVMHAVRALESDMVVAYSKAPTGAGVSPRSPPKHRRLWPDRETENRRLR